MSSLIEDSLAAHLRRARHRRGHRLVDAAAEIGVSTETIGNWENEANEPKALMYPAIIGYIGHEPWREPTTFAEALLAERRRRGLSIANAAAAADVDEGTFERWENGEWTPQARSWTKIEKFMRLPLGSLKDRF